MKVGFIGLGNMGSGMAGSLLKAGHEVAVYNRTPDKAKPLVEKGARKAASVADACKCYVVITMLADDSAVESVVFGDAGIFANLSKGGIHASASTISVALADKLAAEHAKRGQRFVSAPVFGRPEAAATAKLFIVVAGAHDSVDPCMPLFEAMGQKTFRFGEKPSSANLVKISGNFLIASTIETIAEAMTLVAKGGLDRHQYLEFLTSTLFNAPIYKTYGTLIAEKKFKPAGFAAPLGLKDVRLALAAGEALRVPLPLANVVRDRFLTLLARGDETLDWSAISMLAAEDAGLGE
ncbi:MAG TPA: NAD(P)-dependent oxidoreductase [Terriglobales bacterium]|nr:NAD(P)-dependent oxidoreductase [Terriglobales bacterium]